MCPCFRATATASFDMKCEFSSIKMTLNKFTHATELIDIRWQSFMGVINVSSFFNCLHNTEIPTGFWNFVVNRNSLKKIGVYFSRPGMFDDDFEYIARRSKFMVSIEFFLFAFCFFVFTYLRCML